MNKIKHIIKGLYGISESKKMIPAESARFTLNKTVECLEIALLEHDSELLNKVMQKQRVIIDEDGVMYRIVLLKDIEDMKAEVKE